jgi:hypothetical protein
MKTNIGKNFEKDGANEESFIMDSLKSQFKFWNYTAMSAQVSHTVLYMVKRSYSAEHIIFLQSVEK